MGSSNEPGRAGVLGGASSLSERQVARVLAALNGMVAAMVAFAVVRVLPARYALVDLGASIVVVGLVLSGALLFVDRPYARVWIVRASAVVLTLGLALVAGLASAIGWLSGVVGTVGSGGASLFAFAILLVLPYLVVLPLATLVWAKTRR